MSTYTPIASVTLSSAQSSVTFSGIPQTYTDLVLVSNLYGSGGAANIFVRFNSDTGTNYSNTMITGNGSSAASYRNTSTDSIFMIASGSSLNSQWGTFIMQCNNYSNSTTNKTALARINSAGGEATANVGLWRNTSAITAIEIRTSTNNYLAGSTFNLYGVANASITNVAKATGGDSVYTDGTYWYHIFRSSGTFTPTQALTADYLVVAGGGGGANDNAGGLAGGGGGAGGLRCTVGATGGGGSVESALSLSAQAYTVTIGAGGPAGANRGDAIASGSNSVFSTITSLGGSAGLSYGASQVTGGSGGGGIGYQFSGAGCAGTANQGYAGGTVVPSADTPGGGGGGAGAVGGNTSSGNGGNGGAGVTTSISGTSTTYAGGGGGSGITPKTGGTGGSGGGGRGAGNTISSVAGTANTGGGGGGGTSGYAASAGGSGIVIVRYGV